MSRLVDRHSLPFQLFNFCYIYLHSFIFVIIIVDTFSRSLYNVEYYVPCPEKETDSICRNFNKFKRIIVILTSITVTMKMQYNKNSPQRINTATFTCIMKRYIITPYRRNRPLKETKSSRDIRRI